MPPDHKANRDLLNALAHVNQQLGRYGCDAFTSVDDACDLPDYQVRDILTASQLHLDAVRRALRGITG